ncbi:MAG: hypothetical protein LBE91_15035, partial [Tannerella sp.]|nr:hypothetical protein [Tannerella sp.]
GSGATVYQELFGRTTNNNGLLSLQIGKGDQTVSGNLATVDWSQGPYYLRVQIRTGNNSTIDLGNVQLLSVPYALYAEKAKAPNLVLNGNKLGIEGSNTTVTLPSGGSGSSLWEQNATDGVFTNGKVSFKSGSSSYFQADNFPGSGGGFAALNENGQMRAGIGFGEVVTFSGSGQELVLLSSLVSAPNNGGVWIYGSGITTPKAELYAAQFGNTSSSKGRLMLRGGDNRLKAEINSNETVGNTGYMSLYGANEIENVYIGNFESAPNNGAIQLYDDNGIQRVDLYSQKSNTGSRGRLNLIGSDNDIKAILGIDDAVNSGSLSLYGANGSEIVDIGSSSANSNTGAIFINNTNGDHMAGLSSLIGYPSNPAFGLWLNGVQKGGFYVGTDGKSILEVDRLIVDGYVRSAPVDVNTEYTLRSGTAGNTACYASQNGDEITLRGTASLQDGTAVIELPQEVSEKIDRTTATVQVTPLSAESKGLAVTDKQGESFKVQELMSGAGSYAFDWTLTARVKTELRSGMQRVEMPEVAIPAVREKEKVLDNIVTKSKPEASQPQKMINNSSAE